MAEQERIERRIKMYAKWPRVKLFKLTMDLLEETGAWPVSCHTETNLWKLNRLSLATIAVALGA